MIIFHLHDGCFTLNEIKVNRKSQVIVREIMVCSLGIVICFIVCSLIYSIIFFY